VLLQSSWQKRKNRNCKDFFLCHIAKLMTDTENIAYESKIRDLLAAVRRGDREAFNELLTDTGHELRKLAAYYLRRQAHGVTLQTTALVNEAVLALLQMLERESDKWPATKEHFIALLCRVMRFTLIDYARQRRLTTVSWDESAAPGADEDGARFLPAPVWTEQNVADLLAVDEALKKIEQADPQYGPRRARVLECYLFGGLSYREIAAEAGLTEDTARRDCLVGLAQLRELLGST
jgi:RNA polymerase sigma factor (TIGR02999 family)